VLKSLQQEVFASDPTVEACRLHLPILLVSPRWNLKAFSAGLSSWRKLQEIEEFCF